MDCHSLAVLLKNLNYLNFDDNNFYYDSDGDGYRFNLLVEI